MIDVGGLVAFLVAAFFIAIVPGPTVTVIIASALSRGTMAGLAIIFGTQVGVMSIILLLAFGMEALVSFMGWAFDWIKLIGAAYLVWLGFKMMRSSGHLQSPAHVREKSLRDYATQGFVVVWANPKTLIFFGAFLPQFVDMSAPTFPQILFLGGLFMVVAGVSDSVYAILAGQARHWITSARVQLVNRVSGAVLMAGGIWLALQQKS